MATILLFPFPVVIISSFGGTLLAEAWLQRIWYKLIFNVGVITVNSVIIASVYYLLYQPGVPLFGSIQNIIALIALGLSDVIVNGFLVSMVIALASQAD